MRVISALITNLYRVIVMYKGKIEQKFTFPGCLLSAVK